MRKAPENWRFDGAATANRRLAAVRRRRRCARRARRGGTASDARRQASSGAGERRELPPRRRRRAVAGWPSRPLCTLAPPSSARSRVNSSRSRGRLCASSSRAAELRRRQLDVGLVVDERDLDVDGAELGRIQLDVRFADLLVDEPLHAARERFVPVRRAQVDGRARRRDGRRCRRVRRGARSPRTTAASRCAPGSARRRSPVRPAARAAHRRGRS